MTAYTTIATESTRRSRRIAIREIVPIYWRKLIEVGVPINVAKSIAWAIVRYDVVHKVPTPMQQALISQYCRFICRAQLWRSDLLLAPLY